MTWGLLSYSDFAKERVATTHQIKNDRDGGKYMTGSRRMQGIIIYAPLRTQYAHWFAQRQTLRYGERQRPGHRLCDHIIDAQVADAPRTVPEIAPLSRTSNRNPIYMSGTPRFGARQDLATEVTEITEGGRLVFYARRPLCALWLNPVPGGAAHIDRFWDSQIPESHTAAPISPHTARVGRVELRIYPPNDDGTPFGYTSDKTNPRLRISAVFKPLLSRRPSMKTLCQDLRYGVRTMMTRPPFTPISPPSRSPG